MHGARLRLSSFCLGALGLPEKVAGRAKQRCASSSLPRCAPAAAAPHPVCGRPPWSVNTYRTAPESARTVPLEGALRRCPSANTATSQLRGGGTGQRPCSCTAQPGCALCKLGVRPFWGLEAHDCCFWQLVVAEVHSDPHIIILVANILHSDKPSLIAS